MGLPRAALNAIVMAATGDRRMQAFDADSWQGSRSRRSRSELAERRLRAAARCNLLLVHAAAGAVVSNARERYIACTTLVLPKHKSRWPSKGKPLL
jgi:hypothetical protein